MIDGGVYECFTVGHWWDLAIRSDADGYDTPSWSPGQLLTAGLSRVPHARWLALCGAVDGAGAAPFLIGTRSRLHLRAGRLMCFANDVPGFYWNNFGAVTLTIERIR